jgi:hypothetical protein
VAYRYSFGRTSLASGKPLFEYNEAENSMLPDRPFTHNAALLAAIRLYDSKARRSDMIALTSPQALTFNSHVMTDDLIERAKARLSLSKERASKLRGLVFGGVYNYIGIPVSDKELKTAANWGFNSVRVMLTFQTLIDMDVTAVKEPMLQQLEKLVASAMNCSLHLNLVLFSMLGRWVRSFNLYGRGRA